MSARWFYKAGDGEIGPVDVVEVERLIKTGRLGPEDPIRDEESDLFRAVRRVPRFAEVLPKTVVKSRLEAAAVDEVKRNPRLKHKANLKGTRNAVEAADVIARDFESGKYDAEERDAVPLLKRREFVFTFAAFTVLLVGGVGYLTFTTVRRISNQQAYALTQEWMEEIADAAEQGPTSTRFREIVAATPERIAEINKKAYKDPPRGPGAYIRTAAGNFDAAVRAIQAGQTAAEALEPVGTRLGYADLAFLGKSDEIREF